MLSVLFLVVPKKRPCALDPFLEPLIRDLEDSFIKGTDLKYAVDIDGQNIVRCILLLWTGDYAAKCEFGTFIKCGILPCRRHHLRGANIDNGSTYYIANNRYYARFPVEPRVLEDDLPKMLEICVFFCVFLFPPFIINTYKGNI